MFALIVSFVVCLGAADGGSCRQIELPFEGSMQQCMLFGQHQAARWIADHDGYHLRRGWRCLSGRAA